MRHGRSITTALLVAAAMAIAPAAASADPSPLTDDSIENFAAGTTGTDAWAVEPGSVQLARAVSENFDGSTLPQGWSAPSGTPVVGSGALTLDNALVTGTPVSLAPQTLEFRATFGTDRGEHAGLGANLSDGPWALFSTMDGNSGLFVRTRTTAGGAETSTAVTLPGFKPTEPNTYRIEWSSSDDVTFYVNGQLVTTPAAAIAAPMGPVASDLDAGGSSVKIDWLAVGVAPSTATFVSRVLQADDAHTVWGTLIGTGLGVTFETRTGNTAAPGAGWSAWQALGAAGKIQSPAGRYIQYRATLSGAAARLDKVEIGYAIDTTAPSVTIGDVQVSGTTATATFSSPDADIARFECSLDGAAYVACASPKQVTGLAAGAHTVSVRPVDKADNVGPSVSRTFTIDSPAAQPSPSPSPSPSAGSSTTKDTVAPRVTLLSKSVRVSKRGTVSVKVGCPATETRCTIKLALQRGHSVVAHKTVTVAGGKTVSVTLQLTRALRRQLSSHRSVKLTAVLTASDAAGNKRTTKRSLTIRG